jgi:hypothetical protein
LDFGSRRTSCHLTKRKSIVVGQMDLIERECHKALLAASAGSYGFLLYLPFNPKDGGTAFDQNVSGLLPDYVALRPRGQYSFIGSACCLLLASFLLGSAFDPEDRGIKWRCTSTGLYGITYQKMVLFTGSVCCLLIGFLLGFLLNPEDGGSTFL